MPRVDEYIAEYLAAKRIPAVFELIGGMITFLVDAIHRDGRTPLISMHHEQGAAFAAEGIARMTGVPGVAMATSGPGATNLITGIASCFFDSTPAIFITGQVNRAEQKGASEVRQLGFQETEIVKMVEPIVKKAWLANVPEEVPAILEEAYEIATTGRPGPVLIDIPMDVQRATIDGDAMKVTPASSSEHRSAMTREQALSIRDGLRAAERPLILAGGGIRAAGAAELFREFLSILPVPVVHSLMAVDALPSHHHLNAGLIGSYGNRWSNIAMSRSDFLLVLGSRLDVRQTGSDTESFGAGRRIVHVDCDPAEVNNRIKGCVGVISDLTRAIELLIDAISPHAEEIRNRTEEWRSTIASLRDTWPDIAELKDIQGINPNQLMHDISRENQDALGYVVDVGQHQMWAAQSLGIGATQRFLTSGGMGSMGFALPAAIGASIAARGAPVVSIAGDGSFQCNIQELETTRHLNLPIRMIVINNQCHGMVRQFQESYFSGRYQSTVLGYSAPDFAAIADAYRIPAKTISRPEEIAEAMKWQTCRDSGPSLLQVMIATSANAYPKLAFGKGMAAMEPQVLSAGMEGT